MSAWTSPLAKQERNREIASRYAAGEMVADLAREYKISYARVRELLLRAGACEGKGTVIRCGKRR